MKKKIAVLTLCAIVLALRFPAHAQQAAKIFHIGFLDTSTASASAVRLEAFWQELRKLGWIEGKNITIEYRFAEQQNKRLPGLAAELVRLNVDVIVTGGPTTTRSAMEATGTIPIVMAVNANPVGLGFVASLARPEGNVTGLSSLTPELNSKRLEVLKDAVPKLSRIGILRQAGISQSQLKEIMPAALALKLKLEDIEAQLDSKGLESAFKTAKQKQVGAMMTTATRPIFAERKRIVELADEYRLPAIYHQKEFVDDGGLMSYGVDYADLYRRAGGYVDKILKGAKPADLPVQQATKVEL